MLQKLTPQLFSPTPSPFSKHQVLAKIMATSTNPPRATYPPPRNKGLVAGLIKGNQWLISPDHKAGLFWGRDVARGGGWLTSHKKKRGLL